jgi:hypothetical protein
MKTLFELLQKPERQDVLRQWFLSKHNLDISIDRAGGIDGERIYLYTSEKTNHSGLVGSIISICKIVGDTVTYHEGYDFGNLKAVLRENKIKDFLN